MQDIHSIGGGGGGGRLFAGGGDRRLRPHHHHHHQHQHQHQGHQALKCPRCESLNTKFCYYNNYNLSQPRHFCKSCRRYWTKGGVLRNVPVGGGCRKTKRSKPKTNNNHHSSSDAAPQRKSSNSHNSSSDSSSLTANTTTATTCTAVNEVLSATATASASNSTITSRPLFNFQESSTGFFNIPDQRQTSAPNQSFDPPMLENSSADNMFAEIGPFTTLMTSSNDQLPPLGFNLPADISSFRVQGQGQDYQNSNEQQWVQQTESMVGPDEVKMQEMSGGGGGGFMDDRSCQIELSGLQNRTSSGGLDWQGGTDESLFDLTDQSYWSQNQWNGEDEDEHQHLNFLP